MLRSAVALALAVGAMVSATAATAQAATHSGDTGRGLGIEGGQPASTQKVPWMVYLSYHGSHGRDVLCGGALLDAYHVLTAAHCISGSDPTTFDVVQGRTDIMSSQGIVDPVVAAVLAPNFSYITVENDWSVLRVAQPIKAPVIGLVAQDAKVYTAGTPTTVYGWGLPDSAANSETLQQAKVPTVDDAVCQRVYPGQPPNPAFFPHGMVCAGLPQGGVGPCVHDSGGPLVIGNQLAGIVSWGNNDGCDTPAGKKGYPDVYTRVATYTNEIRKAVAQL